MTDHLKFIEKLNGENYGIWKVRMKALLVNKDLWKTVDPNTRNENVSSASTTPAVESPADDGSGKSQQALALIILAINDSQIVHIEECKEARDAWLKLQNLYQEASTANKMRLYEEFLSTKLDHSTPVRVHVEKLSSVRSHLRAVGINIEDSLYKLAMLRSLSHKFEHLVVTLENQIEDITVEDLHSRIYREETRQTNSETGSGQAFSTQFYTRGNKYGSAGRRKTFRCHYCNKEGHVKAKCWKRKEDETSASKRNNISRNENSGHVFMVIEPPVTERMMWFIDSGASYHICCDKKAFQTPLRLLDHAKIIQLGNGQHIMAKYEGEIELSCTTKFGHYNIVLHNVIYLPQMHVNLISVVQVQKSRYSVLFANDECKIIQQESNNIALHTARFGTGYRVAAVVKRPENIAYTADECSSEKGAKLWHQRFGHSSPSMMNEAKKEGRLLGGPNPSIEFKTLTHCQGCDIGKMKNQTYKPISSHHKEMLSLIHSDVCGPMKVESLGKARYFVIYVDDYSRKTFVYFIRHKSDVGQVTKEFIRFIERQTGKSVKALKSDNGGEYISSSLNEFLRENGIEHQYSTPYTPQQNGVAERTNRILLEKARCLLLDAGLPISFWGEAVSTASYIRNITPTQVLDWKTPNECFTQKKSDVSHLKVFGCKAQVFTPRINRKKWDPTSTTAIFLGYTKTNRIYRFYSKDKNKIFEASHAKFYESERGWEAPRIETKFEISDLLETVSTYNERSGTQNHDRSINPLSNAETQAQRIEETPTGVSTLDTSHQSNEVNESNISLQQTDHREAAATEELIPPVNEEGERVTRSGRVSRPPLKLTYDLMVTDDEDDDVAPMHLASEPQCFEEAVEDDEAARWMNAMQQEINALNKNETWELTDLPSGQKVLPCRWVYTRKRISNQSIPTYKARLVAKGFKQSYGVQYFETYAPVAGITSIRLLLSIAVRNQCIIHQMDVKNAFINGHLQEEIYMQQPSGFVSAQYPNKVCKLNKAIYGLKQAAREWYTRIKSVLQASQFTPTKSDPGIFVKKEGDTLMYLVLYVDDILIITKCSEALEQIKSQLKKEFPMKDLDEPTEFLGITINYSRKDGTLVLHQKDKIEAILKRFNMTNAKPISTPLHKSTSKQIEQLTPSSINVPYREAIGCLMYVAMCTRPDISYAVSILSRFTEAPHQCHWNLIKRVLRYLIYTKDMELTYTVNGNDELHVYNDADWGSLRDRKSISGHVLFHGNNLVNWKCKQQSLVALSTTEAEIISMVEGFKELKFVKKLMYETYYSTITPIIFCDNQPCISIISGNGYTGRAKHIDIRFLALQDYKRAEEFDLQYCSTNFMIADLLTKPLEQHRHYMLLRLMQLQSPQ